MSYTQSARELFGKSCLTQIETKLSVSKLLFVDLNVSFGRFQSVFAARVASCVVSIKGAISYYLRLLLY